MRRFADGPLARSAGRVGPGSFSLVMATGIVATALRLAGLTPLSDLVLVIAAAGFVVLVAATSWRWVTQPAAQRADLTCPSRAFAAFTFPAACGVLGLGLTVAGWPAVGVVLAVAGAAAWLALTALIPVRMAASRRARPVIADLNGTWYLWAVATQSLAIMAAYLHTGGALAAGPAAAAALATWLAGLAIYILTMAAVAVRLRRAGLGQPGARAGYWVAMGAASISILAAAHILGVRGAAAVGSARPWITDVAIALWWLATCLIVVLAVATVAVWLRSLPRPRYDRSAWMVVFPLGMYATASQQLGAASGLPAVRLIGEGFTWPAALAWLAVLAVLASAALVCVASLTWAGGRARVAVGLREPSAPRQRHRDTRPGQAERRATRKYQALLKLAAQPADGAGRAPLPWPALRAVVRAQDHRTRGGRLFTALVTTEAEAFQPGNSRVLATMVVIGSRPDDCLGIGDNFSLWRGGDLASGVITRRLFT